MIYKYTIGAPYYTTQEKMIIPTPGVSVQKILDVQLQGNIAVVWATVKPSTEDQYFTIQSVWTGYEEPANMLYISTIQEPSTGLVYHYYGVLPWQERVVNS